MAPGNRIGHKMILFRTLLSSSYTTLAKCLLIKEIFARFYQARTSIFNNLGRLDSLKEAQSGLQEIQEKFLEPNEFYEITAAINDLMQIGREKLLVGRLFDKKWKEIRPKLLERSIETYRVDEVISNWGSQAYVRTYIRQSTRFLHSLEKDICLVQTVRASDWNISILRDVLDLICFLAGLFEMTSDGLKVQKGELEDYHSALDGVELAWAKLFEENKENHKDSFELCNEYARKGFGENFPAKSIKELWMLNELSRRALSGNLMLIYKNKTDEEMKTILRSALEDVQKEFQEFNRKYTQVCNENLTWTPKTIAIVLDSRSGFLFTGASRMSCMEHPLLQQAAIKKPAQQIGDTFDSILAQCNQDWIVKYESLQEADYETRKNIRQQQKPQVYAELPIPGGDSKIFCWAVSGFTLEDKSPCPRCAYFYPSWNLAECQDYFTREYFDKYLRGSTKGLSKNYCAETIAAAAIYAWYRSKLTLD